MDHVAKDHNEGVGGGYAWSVKLKLPPNEAKKTSIEFEAL